MKKIGIFSLALVALLLTGCGQKTRVEEELERDKTDSIILTQKQLNNRKDTKHTEQKISYVNTSYVSEQKENLLSLFKKLRSLGFEQEYMENIWNGADDEQTDDSSKKKYTEEEYQTVESQILEHPELLYAKSTAVSDGDSSQILPVLREDSSNLAADCIAYELSVSGKSTSETLNKVSEIFSGLSEYGIGNQDKLLAEFQKSGYDFMRVKENGLWVAIMNNAEYASALLNDVVISISLPFSSLCVPENYQEIVQTVTKQYYVLADYSNRGPIERILFYNGYFSTGNNNNSCENVMLNFKDHTLIQVDLQMGYHAIKKHKIHISDEMKQSLNYILLQLMHNQKRVASFWEKIENGVLLSGTIGEYEWFVEDNVLHIYQK